MRRSEAIGRAWAELALAPPAETGLDKIRLDAGPVPLYLGRRWPGGERFVALAAPLGDAATSARRLPSLRGLKLEALRDGETNLGLLLVMLEAPDRTALFNSLIDDVAEALSHTDERGRVDTLVTRLQEWRDLFRGASAGLSRREQVGLYGELMFLSDVLAIGGAETVGSWASPEGSDHDFVSGRGAVEIKTTTERGNRTVHISNERQLDSGTSPVLLLCHYSVPELEGGTSLNDLVRSLRARLALSVCSGLFEKKLRASGYHDVHADAYAALTYGPPVVRAYRVEDGFPRLTPADLPRGVSSAAYALELSSCTSCSCDPSEALELVEA